MPLCKWRKGTAGRFSGLPVVVEVINVHCRAAEELELDVCPVADWKPESPKLAVLVDESSPANPKGVILRGLAFDSLNSKVVCIDPNPSSKEVSAVGVWLSPKDMCMSCGVIALISKSVVARADLGGFARG